MREVYIVGAGMIQFGKFPDRTIEDMGTEAIINTLKHAEIGHKDIEAGFVGNVGQPPNAGQRILDYAGMSGIPVFNHENACGSSSAAFRDAYVSVAAGVYDSVIVAGAELMTKSVKGLIPIDDGVNLDIDMGLVMPAFFALMGIRHMKEYGTTLEQLAQVSVKNHRHGTLNPYAQYQKEVSVDKVLNSLLIADPITLLQCTPIGDGAAAVIMTSRDVASQITTKPVRVDASVFTGGNSKPSSDAATIEACVHASKSAYEIAGIGPSDLDVIELHDCFTVHEVIAVEDLGLCPKGEGGRLAVEGKTALGGEIPVNPSGGLLSKGHPLGATGVAQIVELVWQLRGECGKRQVHNAKTALAHNGGGIGPGLTLPAMSITILSI